ncbi:MAG: PKD domain-containing protein, partial [Desulfobacterales bacterium]|nr:PKD domain-containing protein [Desulfobacterales bacterium]
WSWTFGDGATSTDQNPVHTYTTAGTYTVNLTASNAYGSDEKSVIDYITVGHGTVSITASGDGNATIGDEISLTGTNTDSATTYLFLTGPGLNATGTNLVNLSMPVVNDNPSTFTVVDVEIDDSWEYLWDTRSVWGGTLEEGTYTIYAVSAPRDGGHLSDAIYATATVRFQAPTAPVQSTLSFDPPSSEVRTAETTEYSVVLDAVPNGLADFNVTVALTNSSVGEIVGVSYPSWANMPVNSNLPADAVFVQAVDLAGSIGAGAMNVTLCTLTVRGDAVGTTNLTITATTVDDDAGGRYAPTVIDATLTVQNILPFPNPAGGTFPAPTDPNGDGIYEDLDGSGFVGFNDVVVYYSNLEGIDAGTYGPVSFYDYDGNGWAGFNDVVVLYGMIG